MDHIGTVIKQTRKIENFLCENFEAQGRGLHEKVTSIEEKLPPRIVSMCRKVATIRNKVVHEDDMTVDIDDFEDLCEIILLQISKIKNTEIPTKKTNKEKIDKKNKNSTLRFLFYLFIVTPAVYAALMFLVLFIGKFFE